MCGAIPILALSCGAATSQTTGSQVLNDQLNLGDVFTQQTLQVDEVTDSTTAVTVATSNSVGVAGVSGVDYYARSTQEAQGEINAHGVVEVGYNAGSTTVTTAATGNTTTIAGAKATVTSLITQTTGPTAVSAVGQVEAGEAYTYNQTQSTQAVANSTGFLLDNGALGARVTQDSQANVLADGGAIVGSATGYTTVIANAAGNNLTAAGANQSSQRLIASQNNTADSVQASKFTTYGESYVSTTNALATGNNVHAVNEGPLLDVATTQNNLAYIRGQAEGSSGSYSSSEVTAYGAGNSVLAGNIGAEVVIDNSQFNGGGGVEVVAVSDLGSGWDSSATASAYGNASTGYVCSSCSGKMTVRNEQTNDADISSTVTARTQYGRSVSGIATAVGNNASYYVSAPGSSSGN